MAGHSKWSKAKHLKDVLDVKGNLFKEIAVAVHSGGGDAAEILPLQKAVSADRAENPRQTQIWRSRTAIQEDRLLELF